MKRRDPVVDYVERDPDRPEVFWLTHDELGGKARFSMKKPTFATKTTMEEVKAHILNTPHPTRLAQDLAEYRACMLACFDASPFTPLDDVKDPLVEMDDLIDIEGTVAVAWSEVMAYWATFRSGRQA